MRIVAVSDLHLDHVTRGVSRFEELRSLLFGTVLGVVEEQRADVFMFLGDLCDPDSGPVVFRAVEAVLALAQRLTAMGVESVWLAGNHDVVENGTDTTTLTPLRALTWPRGHVHVIEEPTRILLRETVELVAFPYTSSSRGYDPEAWAKAQITTRGNKPVMTISHLAVPGVQPGEETTELPRGREVVFPTKETSAVSLRLQGHFHRGQVFDPGDGGPPIHVVGSLCRLTFNEETNTPGILVADL